MITNNKAQHILNTSATLAGFCFFVIASINAMQLQEKTIIDNITAIAMCLFVLSSIFSFSSIRTLSRRSKVYENIADTVFMSGLIMILIITLLITFNLV